MAAGAFAAPQPIDAIDIQRTGFLYNCVTDTFDTAVTLRNTGGVPLAAPPASDGGQGHATFDQPLQHLRQNGAGRALCRSTAVGFRARPGQVGHRASAFRQSRQGGYRGKLQRAGGAARSSHHGTVGGKSANECRHGNDSVGAGYSVKVDGVTPALTDVAGRANIIVPVSAPQVTVSHPPNFLPKPEWKIWPLEKHGL